MVVDADREGRKEIAQLWAEISREGGEGGGEGEGAPGGGQGAVQNGVGQPEAGPSGLVAAAA